MTNIIIFEDRGTLYTNLVLWRESWFGLVTHYDIYDGDQSRESGWCWSTKFWPMLKEYFNSFPPGRNYNVIARDERAREFYPEAAWGMEWFLVLEPPCMRKYPKDEGEEYYRYKCDVDYRPHPNRKREIPKQYKTKHRDIKTKLLEVLGDSKIRTSELLERFKRSDDEAYRAKKVIEYQEHRAKRALNELLEEGIIASEHPPHHFGGDRGNIYRA